MRQKFIGRYEDAVIKAPTVNMACFVILEQINIQKNFYVIAETL